MYFAFIEIFVFGNQVRHSKVTVILSKGVNFQTEQTAQWLTNYLLSFVYYNEGDKASFQ